MIDIETWASSLVARGDDGRVDLVKTRDLIPRTELRAAKEVHRHLGTRISYGTQTKIWRTYEGGVHVEDNSGRVERMVQQFAEVAAEAVNAVEQHYIESKASALTDPARQSLDKEWRDRWREYESFVDRLHSSAGQRSVIDILKDLCRVDDTLWDADLRWLNTSNGVLDLDEIVRTKGEMIRLYGHNPDLPLTKQTGCSWDENATSDTWLHYITTALPDDDVRAYYQKATGLALLGSPTEKLFVNLIGEGDTGKSVANNMVLATVGSYGAQVPVSVFLSKTGSDFERDEIRGRRFVMSSEPGKGRKIDDDVVKSLTGRDPQRTAGKYAKFVEWKPQCTIFIASNAPIKMDVTDRAIVKRVKPIVFPTQFIDSPDAPLEVRMDRALEDKLLRDLSAILAWMVEGLVMYLNEGMIEPFKVASARHDIETDMEPVFQWAVEALDAGVLKSVDPAVGPFSGRASISSLFTSYKTWAIENNIRYDDKKSRFSELLQTRYGKSKKSGEWIIPGLEWVQGTSNATSTTSNETAPLSAYNWL